MPDSYRLPALRPPMDDLEDIETSWGRMPKWKARALALSEIQAAVREARADDAGKEITPLTNEDQPPRSVADTAATFADLLVRHRRLREIQDMLAKCDELENRLEVLSRNEAARVALMEAERQFTAPEDPDEIGTRH